MSVINCHGTQQRLDRAPLPKPAYRPKKAEYRARNRRWLEYQRANNLPVEKLAFDFNCDVSTVKRALAAAIQDEEAGYTAPEFDHDLATYIQQEYPLGTEIGDNPEVREWLASHGIASLTQAQVRESTPTPPLAAREVTNTDQALATATATAATRTLRRTRWTQERGES